MVESLSRVLSFVRFFVTSSARLFVRFQLTSFAPLFVRLYLRSLVCTFVRSFVRRFISLFVCEFVPSFISFFLHSFFQLTSFPSFLYFSLLYFIHFFHSQIFCPNNLHIRIFQTYLQLVHQTKALYKHTIDKSQIPELSVSVLEFARMKKLPQRLSDHQQGHRLQRNKVATSSQQLGVAKQNQPLHQLFQI